MGTINELIGSPEFGGKSCLGAILPEAYEHGKTLMTYSVQPS